MKYDPYTSLKITEDFSEIDFMSEGKKGLIPKERTRLYRMAIGLNFEELSAKFDIYVYGQNGIVPFSKNMEINAFLIKRKIL